MLLFAKLVSESKPSINDLLDCCSLCKCLSGSGKRLPWILSWVTVDRLTKMAHLIPIKTTYSEPQQAELYMSNIVCLHRVPKKIVSDRGTQFTSKFWERLHETLGTQLCFSSAYHPQTDGHTKRVNQILEDMLRACAMQYGRSWDKSLPCAEFSCNNSYQESLNVTPFEMPYGHRCRTPLF
jgi:transposase InsO family protein